MTILRELENLIGLFFPGGSHRPERFTPSEVAAFVRGIDPSFDSLAARFLQEVSIRMNLKNKKS